MFNVIAVYANDDQTAKPIDLEVDERKIIPSEAEGLNLTQFDAQFAPSGFPSLNLSNFRDLTVLITRDGKQTLPAKLTVVQISAGNRRVKIDDWQQVDEASGHLVKTTVVIRAKFNLDLLCGEEELLRAASTRQTSADFKKAMDERSKDRVPDHALIDPWSNREILYSFCARRGHAPDLVDFSAAFASKKFEVAPAANAEELRKAHKRALAQLLLSRLARLTGMEIKFAADVPGGDEEVFIEDSVTFFVIDGTAIESNQERFAVGVGLSLAEAFQFSWAKTFGGQDFLLIGVAIQDIAKLGRWTAK